MECCASRLLVSKNSLNDALRGETQNPRVGKGEPARGANEAANIRQGTVVQSTRLLRGTQRDKPAIFRWALCPKSLDVVYL